jgi:hypothetical protein
MSHARSPYKKEILIVYAQGGTFEKVGESLQICRTTYAELEREKKAVPG